ncbi:acyltransferase [Schleiferiaceae bacterium]|nr:acyltransferase [Schleiferiaceae bacterium]
MNQNKISFTYRFLRLLGFNYSAGQYGQVTIEYLIKKVWKTYKNSFFLNYFMNSTLLSPFEPRKLRPWVLRKIGCKVGSGVFIGDHVRIDSGYSHLITIEDNVHVTGGCRLLCHQRNLRGYRIGDDASSLPYKASKIHLKKGCMIGMECLIMPGVTIGEGAIIAAYSLVTKDIPAWTIASGRPAKVVKKIAAKNTVNCE